VQPDVTKVGGISEERRIGWMAQENGVRFIPHGWNTAVGLAADLHLSSAFASTDLVAIDQAAYDLVTAAAGLPGSRGEGLGAGVDKFREITGIDGTVAMRYAEARALGTRSYELKTIE